MFNEVPFGDGFGWLNRWELEGAVFLV